MSGVPLKKRAREVAAAAAPSKPFTDKAKKVSEGKVKPVAPPALPPKPALKSTQFVPPAAGAGSESEEDDINEDDDDVDEDEDDNSEDDVEEEEEADLPPPDESTPAEEGGEAPAVRAPALVKDSFFSGATFSSLPLSKPVQDGIAAMGFTTMTRIQEKAIPAILSGKDLLGAAKYVSVVEAGCLSHTWDSCTQRLIRAVSLHALESPEISVLLFVTLYQIHLYHGCRCYSCRHVCSREAGLCLCSSRSVTASRAHLCVPGCDVFDVARTGSGKTLAFLVPIIELISQAQFKVSPNGPRWSLWH